MYKYFNKPGLLMLAGGLPPPDYFPFETITCSTMKQNSFKTAPNPSYVQSVWNWIKGTEKDEWAINKWEDDKTKIQLSTALQYGEGRFLFSEPFLRN
jgi:aromatic amino acid aminotransferase I